MKTLSVLSIGTVVFVGSLSWVPWVSASPLSSLPGYPPISRDQTPPGKTLKPKRQNGGVSQWTVLGVPQTSLALDTPGACHTSVQAYLDLRVITPDRKQSVLPVGTNPACFTVLPDVDHKIVFSPEMTTPTEPLVRVTYRILRPDNTVDRVGVLVLVPNTPVELNVTPGRVFTVIWTPPSPVTTVPPSHQRTSP